MSQSTQQLRPAKDCDRQRPSGSDPSWRPRPDRSSHFHRRDDGHARTEQNIGRLVEYDLHRDALHDLDVIASGVLRWQKAESGTAARLHAIEVAFEGLARKGIDRDVDWLAGAHQLELRFLEIGSHPDLARHEHRERLADGGIGAL